MKTSLKEEIERIHSLSYGNNAKNRDILRLKLSALFEAEKVDDPKKADLVSDDVSKFFQTLEDVAKSGGLKQQMAGYSYQKPVETLQIALMLLGYDLPKHGVDGKFGPETADAILKFKKENQIVSEETSDIEAAAAETGNALKNNGRELESGGELSDKIDNVMADIMRDFKKTNPDVKITISGGNDAFHHTLPYVSLHTFGNAVDLTLTPSDRKTRGEFEDLLEKYKNKVPNFRYLNEYDRPTKYATGGHFHLEIRDGSRTTGGPSQKFVADATPDVINKIIEVLKTKNIKSEDIKKLIDQYAAPTSLEGVAANDFTKIVEAVIENLEGGYYHPDMLLDGRVKDSRYGNSGETMFGIDRKAGGTINDTPEGQQFWAIIDNANARKQWSWNYMGGSLGPELKALVAKIIEPVYLRNQKYLTKEARDIVNSSSKLTFNFVYATWNGPGWFQTFATELNNLVKSGITDPEILAEKMVDMRRNSGNSLVAQGAKKIEKIMDTALS